jgi:glycosyltransferase-like protein
MMSVGLFTYSTKPRGSVVHATYLAEALTSRGHDVTLYALSKAQDRLYREVACPVVYLRAEAAPQIAAELIAQRISEVARGVAGLSLDRHDVLHAEDCLVASGLLTARPQLSGVPIVRTLHHFEHYENAYLRACQRRSIVDADAVACVSRVSQRDVERELGRHCPIIGNGVDADRFAADPALVSWAQAHFGVAGPIVLSVGGVEPRKNSLRALEAMIPILKQHPTVAWVIAGGASIWEHDAYRHAFRQRARELDADVRSRIVELGPVSERELTGLYQIARILLCPSLQEGFGLCVLEALAARVPVVVSQGEPFSEYLTDATAHFVDPHSCASITQAVAQLWADPARCAALGRAGEALAREFAWDRVATLHERFYAGLLETRRHGFENESVRREQHA